MLGYDLHRAVGEDVDDRAAHGLAVGQIDVDRVARAPALLRFVHGDQHAPLTKSDWSRVTACRSRSRARQSPRGRPSATSAPGVARGRCRSRGTTTDRDTATLTGAGAGSGPGQVTSTCDDRGGVAGG